jgi:hypothetical protein
MGKPIFLARLAFFRKWDKEDCIGYIDRGNFHSVLLGTGSLKAMDPRDMLYASVGLLEDGNEDKNIEVGYSRDVELIYKEWALKQVRRKEQNMWYSAAAKTRTLGRTIDEKDEVLGLEGIILGL